jgi:hypothetical protein
LGFQRLARWPKWTPASNNAFIETIGTFSPPKFVILPPFSS